MFYSGFVLSSDAHLSEAMHDRLPVEVWQRGRILDYGGPIEELSADNVRINGGWYIKAVCEFRVR